jgi:hypothetical protein
VWLAPVTCPGGPSTRVLLQAWDQCGGRQCSDSNYVHSLPCEDVPLPYSCCPTGWQCNRGALCTSPPGSSAAPALLQSLAAPAETDKTCALPSNCAASAAIWQCQPGPALDACQGFQIIRSGRLCGGSLKVGHVPRLRCCSGLRFWPRAAAICSGWCC